MINRLDGEVKKQIIIHKRRLQKLKEQQALYGPRTSPEVLIEIEDIEAELKKLQAEPEEIKGGAEQPPSSSNDKPEVSGSGSPSKAVSLGKEETVGGVNWTLVMAVTVIVIVVFLPVVVFWLNSRETSCPHKVLVLIRSFEGSGDLNVERSIHEAFGKAISSLAQTGTGQINVQIIEEDFVIPNVDHVFVVEGWYDNADVHTNISQKNGNQFSPLKDCCPPGEASAVSAVVAIKVSYYVARIWQKEGCSEAAFELLLQLIRQSDLDPEWEKMLCKFAREG